MNSRQYKLKATGRFWNDFSHAADYIGKVLKNPIASEALLDQLVSRARTLAASGFPEATKPYFSPPETTAAYYALPVGNYLAFYVVTDDMTEFRRFLYGRSDLRRRFGE